MILSINEYVKKYLLRSLNTRFIRFTRSYSLFNSIKRFIEIITSIKKTLAHFNDDKLLNNIEIEISIHLRLIMNK